MRKLFCGLGAGLLEFDAGQDFLKGWLEARKVFGGSDEYVVIKALRADYGDQPVGFGAAGR